MTLQELLQRATPRPWFQQGPLLHGPDQGGIDIGPLRGEVYSEDDAALITTLVNRAELYEEAVSSLTNMVDVFSDGTGHRPTDGPFCTLSDEGHEAVAAARAVLSRLREDESTSASEGQVSTSDRLDAQP